MLQLVSFMRTCTFPYCLIYSFYDSNNLNYKVLIYLMFFLIFLRNLLVRASKSAIFIYTQNDKIMKAFAKKKKGKL